MDFPRFLYRSNGENFLCPSQEFLDSMAEKDEWVPEPFTGPRTALLDQNRKGCRSCEALRKEITALKVQIIDLKLKAEGSKPYKSSFAKKIEKATGEA